MPMTAMLGVNSGTRDTQTITSMQQVRATSSALLPALLCMLVLQCIICSCTSASQQLYDAQVLLGNGMYCAQQCRGSTCGGLWLCVYAVPKHSPCYTASLCACYLHAQQLATTTSSESSAAVWLNSCHVFCCCCCMHPHCYLLPPH
jgi:hypothetical protein